jgi:SSS family solute:Na+ symporter
MPAPGISILDFVIMAVYFAGMAWIGWHFSRRSGTTEGYFLGGHRLPSWAIGMSMLATSISSITFLAFPAAAYALDWRMSVSALVTPIIAILGMWLFIPFFRNQARTTAFEYLFSRFGAGSQFYGAITFLLAQSLRMGSILYLMVLPISMITGWDPILIMLFVGVFVALYTIFGGMSAVVWTDVVQAFTLYIGGAAAILVMALAVPGGLGEMVSVAAAHDKFSLGPMDWRPDERTFWVLLIVAITNNLYTYSADQTVVQRYLAASSMREARKATLVSALLALPTWVFFFFMGSCLFAFYTILPDPAVAGMEADRVFPYFIVTQMPVGMTGLVIAGVLAAAMSTLSSSLNSFSTVLTMDVIKPYVWKCGSDGGYARLAKALTTVAATIMLGIAVLLLRADMESLLDTMYRMTAIIGGVLLAFFMLAFFAPKVRSPIIWYAFAVALTLNAYLVLVQAEMLPNALPFRVHAYWVQPIVNVVMIVLALLLSYGLPPAVNAIRAVTVAFARRRAGRVA